MDDDASSVIPAFLSGGGESGALMRSIDWAHTPVGPIPSWPASLKTIVGIILNSRHPMFLWWGPELVQFYNDAYVPSFGKGKHPVAMGQRGADCWPEIWPIISPQIEDVMLRGKPSWHEDQLVPIFRNGRIEDVYWTYGYSPVFDDAGRIGGTLVVCTETTSRVISEQRLRSMRALSESTALAATPHAIIEAAAGTLRTVSDEAPFACIYSVVRDGYPAELTTTVGLSGPSIDAIDEAFRGRLATMAEQQTAHAIPDDFAPPNATWPDPIRHVFVAPIRATPKDRATGFILFGISPRLPFDDAYAGYLLEIARDLALAQERLASFHLRSVVENERNNLLEQAPMATALLAGPDHVFQLANPPYLELVGRSNVVGKRYLEVFPELRGTELPAILDRVYQTGVPYVSGETPIPANRPHAGLEGGFFKFNLQPMRDLTGHVYGMMAVAVDITDQVTARQVLEKAQTERERLLDELRKANRSKDEFLAMLGHELRNPLSPILTALQLMRLRGVQGADHEREVIERQVRHVVSLVDDLLDVSRITRGKISLKRQQIQIADIVAKAIELASPLIERRGHTLQVDVPLALAVDGDASRLAQVVANLLTNAAKYTEPGGEITVRAAEHDGSARLAVRDTGVGIAPEMLPHVFDAFAQEPQHMARSQGGLGLGLAIVKSLVELHGGRVAMHSEGKGRGVECVIELPLATGTAPIPVPEMKPKAVDKPPGGRKLLVVDDNEDAAETLADALSTLGHEVEIAFDGPEALMASATFIPEVALLDLGLPVIDGYELARRLRMQPGWEKVRFMALTGYGLPADRERTTEAGFAKHFVKPIDIAQLDAALRENAV